MYTCSHLMNLLAMNKSVLVITLYLCILCACTPRTEDYFIVIENNSDAAIQWGLSDMYPADSSIIIWKKKAIISPGESFREIHGHFEKPMSWYDYFTVSEIDYGGYLSITVFDANHNSVTWWKVEDYSDVLVRYDLKREDMERLHWRISYPPTEAMKDVHMFPPYETFETNRADVMK